MPKTTLLFNLEELGCQSYYAADNYSFDYLQIFFFKTMKRPEMFWFFVCFVFFNSMMKND